MKILITDKFDEEAIDYLKVNKKEVIYSPEITPKELVACVKDFDCLIVRSRTKVTSEIIDKGKSLKLIVRAGSGTDNIDKETAKQKGIAVINTPGANAHAVAELTVGLMLSLIRKIPLADISMKEGKWMKKDLVGSELYGKTVGVIGYSNVGKVVANLVRAFGTNVLVADSKKSKEKIDRIFQSSDFICLHLGLNDSTRGFVDKRKLSLMKTTSYLVNTARGEVVVEDDLYDALSQGKIAGAALDVYWQEPLPDSSRWLKLVNVILTPHIGGQTMESIKQSCMLAAVDTLKFFNGEAIDSKVI